MKHKHRLLPRRNVSRLLLATLFLTLVPSTDSRVAAPPRRNSIHRNLSTVSQTDRGTGRLPLS